MTIGRVDSSIGWGLAVSNNPKNSKTFIAEDGAYCALPSVFLREQQLKILEALR